MYILFLICIAVNRPAVFQEILEYQEFCLIKINKYNIYEDGLKCC